MKLVQKITSLFLATVFLLSSLGFAANKMVCLKSGKTQISFTPIKDCCPEKNSSTATLKTHCCDIQNSTFKLLDFNPIVKNKIPEVKIVSFGYNETLLFASFENKDSSELFLADLPPPLHGRSLLNFISSLTI